MWKVERYLEFYKKKTSLLSLFIISSRLYYYAILNYQNVSRLLIILNRFRTHFFSSFPSWINNKLKITTETESRIKSARSIKSHYPRAFAYLSRCSYLQLFVLTLALQHKQCPNWKTQSHCMGYLFNISPFLIKWIGLFLQYLLLFKSLDSINRIFLWTLEYIYIDKRICMDNLIIYTLYKEVPFVYTVKYLFIDVYVAVI